MTRNDGAMMDVSIDVNPASESVSRAANEPLLCVPWVVFASGQGLRGEYGTTASSGINVVLEEEISALCREFHNSIGVQEVPDGPSVVLFWKARQSSYWIVTQVLRAPQQPGQRIAYEYFSLALTEDELDKVGGNPLRAMALVSTEELRRRCAANLLEPIYAPVVEIAAESAAAAHIVSTPALASQFSQDGTWPATQENHEALLVYLNGLQGGGSDTRTFATWWPSTKPPRPGVFDIVLRSDATRVAKPHEILAVAAELNHSLSRSLLAPPSYDTAGGRYYRALLHSANEVQTMLNEAYFPAALEESPHRWMTRPQKVAGLCQKIADDLPDYAERLPASFTVEMAPHCAELAERYGAFARELQKLRHPNMLHQSREPNRETKVTGTTASKAESQLNGAQSVSRKGMQLALMLGGLLALCLLVFGVRTIVGKSNAKLNSATAGSKTGAKVVAPLGSEDRRDQQAIMLMRARAGREVFRVARALAARRAQAGKGLSKDAMQSTVVDAVAQAMSQTPHSQIEPSQKRLLFRMATAPIRTRALDGAKEGARQSGPPRRARP